MLLQKSKNLKSQPPSFFLKIQFKLDFQIKMFQISAIAAAVAFHLGLAWLVTFNQFSMSSLVCLLLNVFFITGLDRTNRPENWLLDFMAQFLSLELLVTFYWGLTETLIRLGLSCWILTFTAFGPEAHLICMQLIPTVLLLYWSLPLRQNRCSNFVGVMSQPLEQSASPGQKTQSAGVFQLSFELKLAL